MTTEGLRWVPDVSVGAWLQTRLHKKSGLGATLPSGFESYARVLHPVDDQGTTWAQVCAETGRTPHALMQWQSICRPRDGKASYGAAHGDFPELGDLDQAALSALCSVFADHTAESITCTVGLWEGWGWLHGSGASAMLSSSLFGHEGIDSARPSIAATSEVFSGPRLRLPGRAYLLFRGSLDATQLIGERRSLGSFQPHSPNLIWPEDRAWVVVSEIDFDSTLVGGSRSLIEAVLADQRLEAWPIEPGDSLTIDADTINV